MFTEKGEYLCPAFNLESKARARRFGQVIDKCRGPIVAVPYLGQFGSFQVYIILKVFGFVVCSHVRFHFGLSRGCVIPD